MSYKLLFICSVFIIFGVSADGDQSSTPSVDGDQISSLTWDNYIQLAVIQSSFFRNLDPTNQKELLAILENKQSSSDDMNTELEEWYQKQPPQIQTAAKLYSQNLSQAINEVDAYSQQMQANLSPAAKAFLQQEYDDEDSTTTLEQIDEENDQLFQALPPNVQQEVKQYHAQELQVDQQILNKYLSNRSKRYIHF